MIRETLNKTWFHPNITINNLIKFGITYGVTYPISIGLLWFLTEKIHVYYLLSAMLAGGTTMLLRFILSAIFAFRKGKQ